MRYIPLVFLFLLIGCGEPSAEPHKPIRDPPQKAIHDRPNKAPKEPSQKAVPDV